MSFHDFESEFVEASAPGRPTPSAPRPSTSARPSGNGSARPAARPPSGKRPIGPTPQPRPSPPSPRQQPSRRETGVNWASLQRVGSQLFDLVQGGAQAFQQAQQFANAIGLTGRPPAGGAPSAGDAGQPTGVDPATPAALTPTAGGPVPAAGQPGQPQPVPMQPPGFGGFAQPWSSGQPPSGQPSSFDQLGMLMQALQQRQIPPLPGPGAQPGGAPMPATGQPDALTLLRVMLTNPQLQQALQSPAVPAGGSVQLPVPAPAAPRQMQQVQVPLGAVLNAIFALSGKAMTEVSESMSEEDPELPQYLLDGDGNFLVDPDNPDDRAALVAHLFRLSAEAQRSGHFPQANSRLSEADAELDECEEWARDAGFMH